jgi:uncharacterized membrane protein YhaH (DUF805 family)
MELFTNFTNVMKNKYAAFDGRARRREYWFFQLALWIFAIVTMSVDYLINVYLLSATHQEAIGGGFLTAIFALATIVPNIAVLVRRLHDTDRSGWWALLTLVPLANIALLVFTLMQGTTGNNRFGADPKA